MVGTPLTVVLICISLMEINVEHFFFQLIVPMSLLAISLMKCVLGFFAHLKIGLFLEFPLWHNRISNVLGALG